MILKWKTLIASVFILVVMCSYEYQNRSGIIHLKLCVCCYVSMVCTSYGCWNQLYRTGQTLSSWKVQLEKWLPRYGIDYLIFHKTYCKFKFCHRSCTKYVNKNLHDFIVYLILCNRIVMNDRCSRIQQDVGFSVRRWPHILACCSRSCRWSGGWHDARRVDVQNWQHSVCG